VKTTPSTYLVVWRTCGFPSFFGWFYWVLDWNVNSGGAENGNFSMLRAVSHYNTKCLKVLFPDFMNWALTSAYNLIVS